MRKIKFLSVFILLIFFHSSWAWILRGHALVAEIAYENLTLKAQQEAESYADRIIAYLSYNQQRQLKSTYRHTNNFVRVSGLPDLWRDLSLKEVFERFDAPLPSPLEPYANDSTDAWHFIDQPYSHRCPELRKENIIWALKLLEAAWKQTNNPNAKAIIMIYIEHLVADIHQPLHTFAKTNFICFSDQGGNAYPVRVGHNVTNLHKVWDSGVGYLTHSFDYQHRAEKLQEEFPKNTLTQQLAETNPSDWAKENLMYADFVYSLPKYHRVFPDYYRHGQEISRKQITLAGYRLAVLLNKLLN